MFLPTSINFCNGIQEKRQAGLLGTLWFWKQKNLGVLFKAKVLTASCCYARIITTLLWCLYVSLGLGLLYFNASLGVSNFQQQSRAILDTRHVMPMPMLVGPLKYICSFCTSGRWNHTGTAFFVIIKRCNCSSRSLLLWITSQYFSYLAFLGSSMESHPAESLIIIIATDKKARQELRWQVRDMESILSQQCEGERIFIFTLLTCCL